MDTKKPLPLPLLCVGRSELATPTQIPFIARIIKDVGYQKIVVSAPGPIKNKDPNMTPLLIEMAQGTVAVDPENMGNVLYQGTSVRSPVTRFTDLARAVLTDADLIASFICEMLEDFGIATTLSTATYPDPLVRLGEYEMAKLLSLALQELGCAYPVIDPQDFLQATHDGSVDIPASMRILKGRMFRISTLPQMIIPGYYGRDEHGTLVLLRRNGTKITAVAMAALLGIRVIDSLSYMPGIPMVAAEFIINAPTIPVITHEELSELLRMNLGSELLAQALMLMRKYSISLRIFTKEQIANGGTLVTFDKEVRNTESTRPIAGIGGGVGYTILTITFPMLDIQEEYEALSTINQNKCKALTAFAEERVAVAYENGSRTTLTFVFKADERQRTLLLSRFSSAWPDACINTEEGAVICIVGTQMARKPGIAGRFFSALSKAKVNTKAIVYTGDEYKLAAIIKSSDLTSATNAIYREFVLTSQLPQSF